MGGINPLFFLYFAPMLKQSITRITLALALLFPLLACNITTSDVMGVAERVVRDPTPFPPPTPQGDTISFNTLTYRRLLAEGEFIPGTRMRYVGSEGNSYIVEIDGLTATKQTADSFSWKGLIAPAVVARYNLRLTSSLLSNDLAAVGPVEIMILSPNPTQLPNTNPPASDIEFEELLINYNVPAGFTVPGTTLSYVGMTEDGAELAGTSGYPYFQQGDSLVWVGQLRDNVILRYDLRIISTSADSIRLTGVAKLWISD